MKKFSLLILFIFSSFTIFSQTKTCDSPDENLLSDLNSITKCSIDKSEATSTQFQMEGPAWENENVAFRNYFDAMD